MQGQETESFEDVYRQLEEAVRRLEDGGLTLDESVALYEEGMALARRCQALLEQAELRVTELKDLFTGMDLGADAGDEVLDEED